MADSISLAREPGFRLGGAEVHPPTRQLVSDGASQTLEPRVMQVLVALARARGAILTRDELIQSCWGGRIVGENAIHRVVSRLRRAAEITGGGAFEIETIPKVGYRLIVGGKPPLTASLRPATGRARRWLLAAAGAALAATILLFAWPRGSGDAPPTIAITATEGAGRDRSGALARGLRTDLSGLPPAKAGSLVLVEPAGGGQDASGTDYLVRVGTEQAGGRLRADLSLTARGDARTLWSASFERDARQAIDLRHEAASVLGAVLACVSDRADARRLDPATLSLYLLACGRTSEDVDEDQLRRLRQVVARAPDFARGWALLAFAEARAFAHDTATADPAAASRHISRARALDPNLGETYAAEALLVPVPGRWAQRLRLYERGIAADPDFAPLHQYRSFELTRVGRMQDAVRAARRAVAIEPLSPQGRERLVSQLAYSGQPAAAFAELSRAERIWPDSNIMRGLRYRMELRYGDPRSALRFHDQPDLFDMLNPPADRRFESFLRARIEPSPGNIQRAVETFRASYPERIMGLLQTLGHFGRADEAYGLIAPPAVTADLANGTEVLFRPQMKSLRDDRRFIALAAKLGLLAYWRQSGAWPDFCLDPALPYDCAAEATRLR